MEIMSLLPDAQKAETEILIEVDKFCKKNKLRYSLGFGTLLGAVRHKGFIPWDDDIDIWMPREDYKKFIAEWMKNPIDGYILSNTDTNIDFTQNFTKIRKDNTTFFQSEDADKTYHKGIFIDIFPMDRLAKSFAAVKLQKFYSILMMLYYRKYSPPSETGLKKLMSKFFLGIVPKKRYEYYRKKYEDKVIKLGADNSPYFCPVTFADVSRYYPCNTFDMLIHMQFEDCEFSVTSKYEECLTVRYGDYMQLPSEEEREWKHHPQIIDFKHNYEDLDKKQ